MKDVSTTMSNLYTNIADYILHKLYEENGGNDAGWESFDRFKEGLEASKWLAIDRGDPAYYAYGCITKELIAIDTETDSIMFVHTEVDEKDVKNFCAKYSAILDLKGIPNVLRW